jgi:hypothetical protein
MKLKTMKTFDQDYLETYFEVVEFIQDRISHYDEQDLDAVGNAEFHKGRGGLYELAEEWTTEFQTKYHEVVWGEELEFYDTLEEFLTKKNNQ